MLEFSILTIGSFVTLLDSITIYIGQTCFKKNIRRIIPIFSLVYGLTLGIAGYFTPNVAMGANIIEAIFIGLSAGAAATGINQVGKQLSKDEDDATSSVILYLKKFLDSIEVPENVDNEIPCDGDVEDTPEAIEVPESETPEEVVPSTEDVAEQDEESEDE
jgi:hypothetical protein